MKKSVTIVVAVYITLMYKTDAHAISNKRPIISFTKGIRDHILLAIGKCSGSVPQAYEYITIIREGKYPDDDDFKKFIHCGFRDAGYTLEDGRIRMKASEALFPDPVAMKLALEPCRDVDITTPVETTYEHFKCFQQRSPYLIGP